LADTSLFDFQVILTFLYQVDMLASDLSKTTMVRESSFAPRSEFMICFFFLFIVPSFLFHLFSLRFLT